MRHQSHKSRSFGQVVSRNLRLMLPLVAVCGLGLAQSALAQVSRTPWEMHEGQDVIKLDAELPPNGALPENGYIACQHAEIPVEGSGWAPAPNPDTIGFGGPNASQIGAVGAHAVEQSITPISRPSSTYPPARGSMNSRSSSKAWTTLRASPFSTALIQADKWSRAAM